jgi:drug/metabolite transporter (DMT)-like permease
MPVIALTLGVIFRDEIVAPLAVVGSLLVIAGAILASRREASLPTRRIPVVDIAGDVP